MRRGKTLRAFRSDADFVRFVETHDLADYWDAFVPVEPVQVDPKLAVKIDRRWRRKRLISLRLETWQIRLAKAVAAREGVPYHAVIRRWIERGIQTRRAV